MYMFVEERIKDSIDKGEFDNLPGKGKPLNLKDDLPGMRPEIKMGYRMLKNAGYVTEEAKDSKNNMSMNDLLTIATGKTHKSDVQSKQKFDEFVHERKLHQNKRFIAYAKKIYRKLF
ncbi:DUF1992 domain-containing protein [Virgibacillus dakarensis]|uniref:DUF1992 domain-containing protein n=1 Tax=Lentibacillus populi TaxID=1827502 RepID=A0A9W5TZN7_9BACI|nr:MULTISPECIES: DUF1992 domain-containing protein [Bacillaceae]MBT2216875.1 DUF1992 domain-containing protein [Virgibacillus dakarensis]MTW88335.1 DUF1992 domain-containing protein [Virgibacillus dakarensis]GGB52284.1 DUF1992 domain-containing protein [Lentibacillus populi]